jgi:hypothetical protein
MTDELHRVEAAAASGSTADSAPPPAAPDDDAGPVPAAMLRIALVFAAALVVCLLAYLAAAVPGPWFPSASRLEFGPRDLRVSRGTGTNDGAEVQVQAVDASGMAIVAVVTDFRSTDYAAVAWVGIDFPENADVTLLWQSDVSPGAINGTPIRVESGRPLPVTLTQNPKWVGRIKGLALAFRGKLGAPLVLRGVIAKPLGAAEILGDRMREWLAFESWTGTSINTITGGADLQALPLPLLLAAAVALAGGALALVRRFRPRWAPTGIAATLAALFLVAWLLQDLRWTANLARQVAATHERFGGKSGEARDLANDDGPLYAFVQKALAVMPKTPVRVFVAADAHYFRGRAAYHLYPNSVYAEPRANTLPPADALRTGDWLLVYQRRGMQYDAAQKRIRWDDGQSKSAELRLLGTGAALFEIL